MKVDFKVIHRNRLSNGKIKQHTSKMENVDIEQFDRTFKTFDTGEISWYKKGKNYYYNDKAIGVSRKFIPIDKSKKKK